MAIERLETDLESLAEESRAEERDLSLPPRSHQAEEAVLGSILKNPSSVVRVADFLRPEDFHEPRHRHVFRAMLSLFADGIPIDYHSTADCLQQQGSYEASGGLLYLSELNLATPSAAHIEHYGRQPDNRWLLSEADSVYDTIHLPAINCHLALAEVYDKVDIVVE